MKAILLMVGIFLLLIVTFIIIWVMTADRAGNAEASLPDSNIEYVEFNSKAAYNQIFI